MDDPAPHVVDPAAEAIWKGILLGTDPRFKRARARLKHLPSEPRCKLCAAPFGAPGAVLMRLMGRGRWPKNPRYCETCFGVVSQVHGGAEIEGSFLFADVRGSTTLAESMSPSAFRAQLGRFYDVATRVLIERDAVVDKFIGDEVFAIFIPALTHEAHAEHAIQAALDLLRATGQVDPGGPWLPIGIGVHTGIAYVGSVGLATAPEFTAVGDVVNTTARLASAAAAGELLVTDAASGAAGFDISKLERRSLALKGKAEATSVAVATVRPGRQ
ncbi:MAG: adenylate/guanylate cyclase domain-containing protein [Candidatus Limnocylindrales bacterium]